MVVTQHTLKNKNQVAFLLEDDLFYVEYAQGVVCDEEDFKFTVDAYAELSKGKVIRVLAVFPEFTDITPGAREYLENREIPAIAEAVVLFSLAQRILFNSYKMLRSKHYPIKGFRSKEKALEWLKKF